MRIVCISDTHGLHRKLTLPFADILIHAGDFMVHGRAAAEIDDFNHWLGTLPHRHKIVVAGNHDILFETNPKEARDHLSNAVYLENSGITLEGLRFWGSPITPVLPHMAFAVERGGASKKHWDKIPVGTDVLVTHGPPLGSLDRDHILSSRIGCDQLTKAILRIRPKVHIFGHVHGGYGQEAGPNGTYLVNCAVLNGTTLNPPMHLVLD
jgi:Icc-related predicted phosphoesterase